MMVDTPLIDMMERMPNIDMFYITNKDPNYHYCWLNTKPENIERAKAIWGWEVLGEDHKENALVPPNAAGERKLGDVVLARMPMERWERIQRIRDRQNKEAITRANDAWRDEVEKSGIQTQDTTKVQAEVVFGDKSKEDKS